MKLTTARLKKLIREELKHLSEGKRFHPYRKEMEHELEDRDGHAETIVIYYEDEFPNPDEDPREDIEAGEDSINSYRSRGVDQSVRNDSADPDYMHIKNNLTKHHGYDFKLVSGEWKVRPPNKKQYVDFIIQYQRRQ
mgnify:CR=1 FL=1|tara:strand:- start:832 stop:1242 length:411 start_codon:yes stop_codon:yes gene_type:complete